MSLFSQYMKWLKNASLRYKIIIVFSLICFLSIFPMVIGVTYYYNASVKKNSIRQSRAVGIMLGKNIHEHLYEAPGNHAPAHEESAREEAAAEEAGPEDAMRNTAGQENAGQDAASSRGHSHHHKGDEGLKHSDSLKELLSQAEVVDDVVFASLYGRDQKLIGAWSHKMYTDQVPLFLTKTQFEEHNYLGIVKVSLPEHDGEYSVLIGVDMMPRWRRYCRNVAMICTGLCLIFIVMLVSLYVFSRKVIIHPLEKLNETVDKINKKGNLGVKISPRCNDEIGQLTVNFMELVSQLKAFVNNTDNVTNQMFKAGQAARAVTQSVASGATSVGAYIASSTSTMEELLDSFRNITHSMEELGANAGSGLDAVNVINQMTRSINNNVQNMNASISSSSDLITKMGRMVEESAKNVGELSDAIVSTSASMLEIERSVNEVENNAQSSAAQTKEVQSKVTESTAAIKRTTEGIANIRRSSTEAATVINNLGERIGDIGSIVHVIEDITKQTNLLALNAAIIAAQAGEHGRSFSVVSDEISALAQRTRHSTTEIADLIENIQEESRHAVVAMEQDMRYIDQGVALGENAENILKELQQSVTESTHMAERIAVSAVEQSNAIKTVNKSIENVAHSIQLITANLDNQSESANHIVMNTNNLNSSSKELANSANEQSRRMTNIVESITNINTKVLEIKEDQKRRTEDTKGVLESIRSIKGVCQQQGEVVGNLGATMDPIDEMTANLQDLLSRFTV